MRGPVFKFAGVEVMPLPCCCIACKGKKKKKETEREVIDYGSFFSLKRLRKLLITIIIIIITFKMNLF